MADALVVVADERHYLHGAQQPPRPGAADASHASAEEILERGFHLNHRYVSAARAVAMGRPAAAIVRGESTGERYFKSAREFISLTLIHKTIRSVNKFLFRNKYIAQNLVSTLLAT